MRALLVSVGVCLLNAVGWAEDQHAVLRMYLTKSDLVVLGKFVTEPESELLKLGVMQYRADFRVKQIVKGSLPDLKRRGVTIPVEVVRFETEAADRPNELTLDGECLLFLSQVENQKAVRYVTVDAWFGVQTARPTLLITLLNLMDATQSKPSEAIHVPPAIAQHTPPVRSAHPQGDIAGDYRIFLPAGFEHHMTLKHREDGDYDLEPDRLNFGGRYRRSGDQLISLPVAGKIEPAYVWQIRSPYLMTLVDHPTDHGANYLNAVLYRPRTPTETPATE